MWVNHEYTSELFVTGAKQADGKFTADQVQKLLYNQGGSIIRVKRENGKWKMLTESAYARRVVVYMGDDKTDVCVYKYVSKGKFDKAKGRDNSALLEDGTLYVADMKNGKWVALTVENVQAGIRKAMKEDLLPKFQTQADVLVYAQEAALLVGGTPTDRPEDVEISPFDNTIFIAHTNNEKQGNFHGHITRFFEKDNDLGALEFDFEIFAAGGRQSGFSAPDNLTFDSNQNLWTVTDISSSKAGKGIWRHFGNNGMFVIPTSGEHAGEAFQFASAPVEAEMTGPWFTPDESTLCFIVVRSGVKALDSFISTLIQIYLTNNKNDI